MRIRKPRVRIIMRFLITVFVIAVAGLSLFDMSAQAQVRLYRTSDRQMQTLLSRIETRADRFSTSLERALDRSYVNGTQREDEVNRLLTDFEYATDQLRERFNRGVATRTDVELALQRAALLNNFMVRERMDARAERDWTLLRNDLNQLARNYYVAWNWNAVPGTTSFPGGLDAQLTGTYRLNLSQSTNTRIIAEDATRNLDPREQQRIYNALMRRLDQPELLSIERRGNQITIASSRAPQVTISADGRSQFETLPNGHTVRTRAMLNGDQLNITTTGDRANDFTVNFDPISDGQRLLVTRRVFVEHLGRPVVVESDYDRTSTVAQWNIFTGRPSETATAGPLGTFIIPNGTLLVATLNNDISTRTTRNGDRFTMTVREPGQYEGALIEGYVSNVERAGRITGRSQMTLNYESIRLRNGAAYSFAGLNETVRTLRGDTVHINNEGAIREDDSQTSRTITRTAIGTAVGAIIGAIAGGGEGAAIGGAIGAGAGAGSVYIQGRDDLELSSGTELTIRASAPR